MAVSAAWTPAIGDIRDKSKKGEAADPRMDTVVLDKEKNVVVAAAHRRRDWHSFKQYYRELSSFMPRGCSDKTYTTPLNQREACRVTDRRAPHVRIPGFNLNPDFDYRYRKKS
jgi:UDP-N-acetylglucosamine 2-epimerase